MDENRIRAQGNELYHWEYLNKSSHLFLNSSKRLEDNKENYSIHLLRNVIF